jgi:hypothetical protein
LRCANLTQRSAAVRVGIVSSRYSRDNSTFTAYERIAIPAVRLKPAFSTLRNSSEPVPMDLTLYAPKSSKVATQSSGRATLSIAYSRPRRPPKRI